MILQPLSSKDPSIPFCQREARGDFINLCDCLQS
jgi:hypothetical protein